MNTATIRKPEIESKAISVAQSAQRIQIRNDETYLEATSMLTAIKAMRKEVDDTFNPVIYAAHRTHQEAIGAKKKIETPLIAAENLLKRGVSDYQFKKEQERIEAQRKLEAAARKIQEDRIIAEAAAAEKDGDPQLAAEILNAPVPSVPVILPSPVIKVDGISRRENWQFRIKNEQDIPREYLMVDESKIRKIVKALKKDAEKHIPGIEVYDEGSIAVKA